MTSCSDRREIKLWTEKSASCKTRGRVVKEGTKVQRCEL